MIRMDLEHIHHALDAAYAAEYSAFVEKVRAAEEKLGQGQRFAERGHAIIGVFDIIAGGNGKGRHGFTS